MCIRNAEIPNEIRLLRKTRILEERRFNEIFFEQTKTPGLLSGNDTNAPVLGNKWSIRAVHSSIRDGFTLTRLTHQLVKD